MFIKAGFFEGLPEGLGWHASKGINVLANCSFEEERDLRNNRDVLSQGVEAHLEGVVASDLEG
jgi:hypothetical protein